MILNQLGGTLFKGGGNGSEGCDGFGDGWGPRIRGKLSFPPHRKLLSPDVQPLYLRSTGSVRGVAVGLGLGPVSLKNTVFYPSQIQGSMYLFSIAFLLT